MNRKSVSLTASENLRVALTLGNAVLVQLEGTGFTGTVDFKSSTDGVTWTNHPYVLHHNAAQTLSVAQITDPSTVTTYLIKPPVTGLRIDVVVAGGTLDVVYREVRL